MTVADLYPAVEYDENGVALSFPAPFRYFETSNLLVQRELADGTVVWLTEGVDWTATPGPTDAGGAVTLTAGVAGAKLRISRATPRTQQVDYATTDRFPAETHERALDKNMMVSQEMDEALDRTLRFGFGQGIAPLQRPGSNKVLATDIDGNFIWVSSASFGPGPQGAPGGTVDGFGYFTALAGLSFPAGIKKIVSDGYDANSPFPGVYISDALATLALATAHPRLCKADASGKYWRYADGWIAAEHAGARGAAGINDQPAIQAAVSYAKAAGIREVRFLHRDYELWAPFRTSSLAGGPGDDGRRIVIRAGVALKGLPPHSNFKLMNPVGASRNAGNQTDGGNVWLGGCFYVAGDALPPPATPTIDMVSIEDIHVDGNITYNPAWGDVNLTDKGFMVEDSYLGGVRCRNLVLRHFKGEIFYVAQNPPCPQVLLQDCIFEYTPQSALNPYSAERVTCINVTCGYAYLAAELSGWKGGLYLGCRFHNSGNFTLIGGPVNNTAGYAYYLPARDNALEVPFVNFEGVTFDRVTNVNLSGGWMRGKVTVIDGGINLIQHESLQDIELTVEHWTDLVSDLTAVAMGGPPDLTTQAPGAPVGVFYKKPSNIRFDITCRQTKAAKAAGRIANQALLLYSGLYDRQTVRFRLHGEAKRTVNVNEAPALPAAWEMPLIEADADFGGLILNYGGPSIYPGADFTITVKGLAVNLEPSAAGTWNGGIATAYQYVHGQRLRITDLYNTPTRILNFAKNGPGMLLQADRTLRRAGEYLDLMYDANFGKWTEVAYVGQGA